MAWDTILFSLLGLAFGNLLYRLFFHLTFVSMTLKKGEGLSRSYVAIQLKRVWRDKPYTFAQEYVALPLMTHWTCLDNNKACGPLLGPKVHEIYKAEKLKAEIK